MVYPDNGKTKQDVADYYDTVMAWLLPEISGRPLSIIRCPQGSTRPCFFQKHLAAGMQYVDSVPVEEESGQTEDYLVVRDARAVRELVQFNALEFQSVGRACGRSGSRGSGGVRSRSRRRRAVAGNRGRRATDARPAGASGPAIVRAHVRRQGPPFGGAAEAGLRLGSGQAVRARLRRIDGKDGE